MMADVLGMVFDALVDASIAGAVVALSVWAWSPSSDACRPRCAARCGGWFALKLLTGLIAIEPVALQSPAACGAREHGHSERAGGLTHCREPGVGGADRRHASAGARRWSRSGCVGWQLPRRWRSASGVALGSLRARAARRQARM